MMSLSVSRDIALLMLMMWVVLNKAQKLTPSLISAVSTPQVEVTANDAIQSHGVTQQSDFFTSQVDDVALQTVFHKRNDTTTSSGSELMVSSAENYNVTQSNRQTDSNEATDFADDCCDNSTEPGPGLIDPLLRASTRGTPTRHPTVSKELYGRIKSVLDQLFVYFELFSIILTTISATIYALPNMRCGATAYYVVALNVADTLTGLPVVIKNAWALTGNTSSEAYWYLIIYGATYLSVSCRRMVYCLFTLLSAERFFVIAFPLKARHSKIIRYPKVCVVVVALGLLTYHVYLPLKKTVVPLPKGQGYRYQNSELYLDHSKVFEDVSTAAKVMFSYLPLSVCLALCVALKVALHRHMVARKSLREPSYSSSASSSNEAPERSCRASSAESQLARTIWMSTLMFTLLSLPSNTVQIVSSYHPEFNGTGFERNLYVTVTRVSALALTSSRFTNFLAYLCLSTSFRNNLLRGLFCLRKLRPARGMSGATESSLTQSRCTVNSSLTSIS